MLPNHSDFFVWFTSVFLLRESVAEDLSVVSLAAKLDQVDRSHVDKHKETNTRILNIDQKHR